MRGGEPLALDFAHHQRAARQDGGAAARGIGGVMQDRFDHLDAVRRRNRGGERIGGQIADIMVGEAISPRPAAGQVEQRKALAEQQFARLLGVE